MNRVSAASTEVRAQVRGLQTLRRRLHRLGPSRPLRDARAAAVFVKERRIVVSTGRSSLPALSEAIAGHSLPGSWMAHPEVHRIHKILGGIKKHSVVAAPLIMGKETMMHASLGPAVERIASDRARRDILRRLLPPLARKLLHDVEAEGELRMDRWGVPTRQARTARLLLERELLVASRGLHTERGYHTCIVQPWGRSEFSRRFAKKAVSLDFDKAQDLLWVAALRSAVIAPEQEARRWFAFGTGRLDALLANGKIERYAAQGRNWLTCPK